MSDMRRRRLGRAALAWLALAALTGLAAGCSRGGGRASSQASLPAGIPQRIKVSSPAFTDGAAIPARFSCDGEERSPPLAWSGVPAGTAELALVVDDPDAPGGTFVHWVVFHLDPRLTRLAEGTLPRGARQAQGSSGRSAWTGPCPPPGPAHHYRFTVYALSHGLSLDDGVGAQTAIAAIARVATASGRLTGTFRR